MRVRPEFVVADVDGLSLAHRRAGWGPPLVLAHGAAQDSRVWGAELDGLCDAFTVIAWDEPGAGGSADPPDGFALPDYADTLAGLLRAVADEPAHVAGLSWGGTVVLELYRRHPDLVASLVLIDTYAGWKGSLPSAEVQARVAGAEAMLAVPPEEFDPTLPGLFAGDPPADAVALLAEMGADVRRDHLARQLAIMAETDLGDVLPRITAPTLLLWGELDTRSPLAVARAFHTAIPHAELVVVPGAGHLSHLERPAEVMTEIRRFCG